METVIIVVHLMVIVAMVAVVLMQRSEGGALGIGGTNSFMTTRGQGNVLTRSTAILAAVFFVTSLSMGILARMHEKPSQILDTVPAAGTTQPAPAGGAPATGTGGGTILDQLNKLPKAAPELPSTDGTTLPGSQPAGPNTPQVPTGQ